MKVVLFLVLVALLNLTNGINLIDDVLYTIFSQRNSFHINQMVEKRERWTNQLKDMSRSSSSVPRILLTHELNLEVAAWTVTPVLKALSPYLANSEWFFFAQEETEVNFAELEAVLNRYDPHEELFLGHSLEDLTPTILHHYVIGKSLKYPHFPSGWLLSLAAMDKILHHINKFSPSFNIDPQYEFAQFVLYLRTLPLQELLPRPPSPPDNGIKLTNISEFCLSQLQQATCATHYKHTIPNCERDLTVDQIHFAVKTCSNFHSSRLPLLRGTWAEEAGSSITYYSDTVDPAYSTISTGVPNTERGHCGKTEAIIRHFSNLVKNEDYEWLVIADDDTLLSVPRLIKLLKCYNISHPILLGEVYGYLAHRPGGTSYVTGGGSMVLSKAAVSSFISSSHSCPSIDAADDMFLGSMAAALDWDIIHSPLFHQAQPDSFQEKVLSQQTSISFHRHRPNDPLQVYFDYLSDSGRSQEQSGRSQERTDREHRTMTRHKTEL